ncbi:hypothetical protein Drorol1_Dr00015837 [Drosera rotundifolia]
MPRRSARISEKAKLTPPEESETPTKKPRKSSASKKDNKDTTDETKTEEVPMKEAEKDGSEAELKVTKETQDKEVASDAANDVRMEEAEKKEEKEVAEETNEEQKEVGTTATSEAPLEKAKLPDAIGAERNGVEAKQEDTEVAVCEKEKVEAAEDQVTAQTVAEAEKQYVVLEEAKQMLMQLLVT